MGLNRLNRPAYAGMCILDLSKTLMYDFHHNYIKEKYGSRAKLLFTDTDSLSWNGDLRCLQWFLGRQRQVWNSDYAKDSPYFDATNAIVIGKFKDEAAGIPITEFIGLRSKMYSYVKDNGKNEKTAKGIRKYMIKKNIAQKTTKILSKTISKSIILWKQSEVFAINWAATNLVRFHCPALMSKDISSLMVKFVMHMAKTK